MKKVKYRYMFNDQKEEDWVNELSQQGWHLEKFTLGKFTFTKGKPGAYIYRNEYLLNKSVEEKQDYRNLLEDSGIEVVHQSFDWIYVRKRAEEGSFELFSDKASKRIYYEKMSSMYIILFMINAALAFANLTIFNIGNSFLSLNAGAGFIGITALIILSFPIYHIRKTKKSLEEDCQLHE